MLRKCFAMNTEKEGLPVSDLTDQEQTCAQKLTCILEFEMTEKLLNFYHVSGLIKDMNKHQLALAEKNTELEIMKLELPGPTFIPESLEDTAIGVSPLS